MAVLFPPTIVQEKRDDRFIFLAGPIQGAPRWQDKAVELLSDTGTVLASPRTSEDWHGDYYGQVDWELHYLKRAYSTGCILFWLACQTEETPGRSYAQTTRFELGEWIGRAIGRNDPSGIVVGIEPGFTNERYLRHRIKQARQGLLWDDFQIHSTLEDTCTAAAACVKTLR